ncbi:transglutaminase-like domain-containing protein [Maribacter sp. IgM3_T14_3]|uniref:transglutaminase-like domain-containing protein n=1 Tax=Maribacter sp. IgM3_T14_3 TaxID=3415140 RepID=UPI003C6F7E22
MPNQYNITYRTENTYENWVNDAYWQFLIIPMENNTQHHIDVEFSNSLFAVNEFSINGYGFRAIRVHSKKKFKKINFEAKFSFIKDHTDPFNFPLEINDSLAYKEINELIFKINFEAFLRSTPLTKLPNDVDSIFEFNLSNTIFENLQELNKWTFTHLQFKTGVTQVDTKLTDIISVKQGVCQDFTHLFCAIARQNGIPTRYVSGYLNQEHGLLGDSQMHAWAECYIPQVGWKGFDPTNNILANTNHIKVCHGKDYNDCSPLRGIIYSHGRNKTTHTVKVQSQEQ